MSKNSYEGVVYENAKGRHYSQYKLYNYSFWNLLILRVYDHSMATQMNCGYLQLTLFELTYLCISAEWHILKQDQIIMPICFRISIYDNLI
jgi:hypothetical protein